MQADLSEFKITTQADIAELRLSTTADAKDLEIRLTSEIGSVQNRLMAWTLVVVSVATGLVIALDRLFGPATGG